MQGVKPQQRYEGKIVEERNDERHKEKDEEMPVGAPNADRGPALSASCCEDVVVTVRVNEEPWTKLASIRNAENQSGRTGTSRQPRVL